MAQIDSSFEPNLPASVSLLTGKHPESYEGGEGGQSRADSGGILPLTSDAARYTSPSKDAGDSAGNDFGSWQNY